MDTFDNIVDRKDWPSGLWDHEPDRAVWVHEATGARCTLRRGTLGHWCGYVGVNSNHPAVGKPYDLLDVMVHGGLSYAAYCRPIEADEWIRYRIAYDKWKLDSLIWPDGDAARQLREDAKGDTSTLLGFKEWMRGHVLCHDDCPHGLWWLGFDCGHAFDISPGLEASLRRIRYESAVDSRLPKQTYKTFEYAMRETNALAAELFEEKLLSNLGG